MTLTRLERELRTYVRTYQEYNASACAELDATPTALEFHREYVAQNRPVVLRGQGYRDGVPALARWSDAYLVDAMQDRQVDVSVDPTGNADSIVDGHFVEPASVKMTMSDLFERLRRNDEEDDVEGRGPVWYAQSQSGNLSDEYAPLLDDVGTEGPVWAREALGESPDVANVWIGGRRSKTSLHKDPYENIYLVVRGTKEFILFPPSEAYCLHERTYPHATWSYSPSGDPAFTLVPTVPPVRVPWIPIDPTVAESSSSSSSELYPRYRFARPMRVEVHAGDMLYLPSLWFHYVSQSPRHFHDDDDEEGGQGVQGVRATIAVNWWFDMKFDGAAFAANELNRNLIRALDDAAAADDDDSCGGRGGRDDARR
ncbi:hypothetical protein JCM11491_002264 [Sporobolomyces phaffii]